MNTDTFPYGKRPGRPKGTPKQPATPPQLAADLEQQQQYALAARIARALGDDDTLRIVELIEDGKRLPSEMQPILGIGYGLVENRLVKLRKLGVVQSVGIPPNSHNLLRSASVIAVVRELLALASFVRPFLPSTENDHLLLGLVSPNRQEG